MPAFIDKEKCTACGNCVEECPVEAISLVDEEYAVVNNDECTECELCIDVCEQGAIRMIEEEE